MSGIGRDIDHITAVRECSNLCKFADQIQPENLDGDVYNLFGLKGKGK